MGDRTQSSENSRIASEIYFLHCPFPLYDVSHGIAVCALATWLRFWMRLKRHPASVDSKTFFCACVIFQLIIDMISSRENLVATAIAQCRISASGRISPRNVLSLFPWYHLPRRNYGTLWLPHPGYATALHCLCVDSLMVTVLVLVEIIIIMLKQLATATI